MSAYNVNQFIIAGFALGGGSPLFEITRKVTSIVVPEPTTLAALGLAPLLVARRRV